MLIWQYRVWLAEQQLTPDREPRWMADFLIQVISFAVGELISLGIISQKDHNA